MLAGVGKEPGPLAFMATLAGAAIIGAGPQQYFCEGDGGAITVEQEAQLLGAMEFDLRVTPVAFEELVQRYGIDMSVELTDCQRALATLLWTYGPGLWLAIGLGGVIADDPRLLVGIFNILGNNAAVMSALNAAITVIEANPTAILACAEAIVPVFAAVYAAGLLWKVVKFALSMLGWYALFWVLAKILGLILGLEVARLVASVAVWIAQAIYYTQNAFKVCRGTQPVLLTVRSG